MSLANSLEPKLKWIAFPGLIRGIGIIHFFVFVLLVFNWDALPSFIFNEALIAKGEYWRAISSIALPPILPRPDGFLLLSTLLMFFILRITFLINDSLEQAWGTFRTSLYVYAVLGCMILAHFWSGPLLSVLGGLILYEAIFIAFATIFPNIEFRLFLIVPVKIGILAIFLGIITILQCFQGLEVASHILLTFSPYLLWAIPRFFKWYIMRGRTMARRNAFQRQALPEGEDFHRCEQCGATDSSHPERDFRVTGEDRELCNTCLGESS